MPEATDCVIDSDSVDQTGPIVQVLAEAIPGQGVRRFGGDVSEGSSVMVPGRRVRPLDLLLLHQEFAAFIETAKDPPAKSDILK